MDSKTNTPILSSTHQYSLEFTQPAGLPVGYQFFSHAILDYPLVFGTSPLRPLSEDTTNLAQSLRPIRPRYFWL